MFEEVGVVVMGGCSVGQEGVCLGFLFLHFFWCDASNIKFPSMKALIRTDVDLLLVSCEK